MKKLIAFDLDGTLAESKSPVTGEMGSLLSDLLNIYQVAIISGGAWKQFKTQLIPSIKYKLERNQLLKLTLMPTSGASMYKWEIEDSIDGWTMEQFEQVYDESLNPSDVAQILLCLYKVIGTFDFNYTEVHGNQIENRGSQITFSALGQQAPLHLKEKWDPYADKRKKMVSMLRCNLPEFEVRYGGSTSIDVTKKGIDKSFGMSRLMEISNISKEDILFVGDALSPGGNDHAVKEMGIDVKETSGPKQTIEIIEELISLNNA